VFQMMNYISILWFISFIPLVVSQLSNDPDQLLNWCLDGKHHKSRPGPEDDLYKQVSDCAINLMGAIPLCNKIEVYI